MIDIHTHILPQFDDGAQSVDEAIELVAEIKSQGAENVVLSSHFYTDRESVKTFCERYAVAYDNFAQNFDIKPLKGAEVAVGNNFFHLPTPKELLIEGTEYMLIELPFCSKMQDWVYGGIAKMLRDGVIPIVAHVELYPYFSVKTVEKLKKSGALIQVNASSLFVPREKKKIFKLFCKDYIDFLATDTHNNTTRRPRLKDALTVLTKKFGNEKVNDFIAKTEGLMIEL